MTGLIRDRSAVVALSDRFCEASDEDHGSGEDKEGEREACGRLVIACLPATPTGPAHSALDHPASLLYRKARLPLVRLDDLDGDRGGRADPLSGVRTERRPTGKAFCLAKGVPRTRCSCPLES